VLGAYLVLFAVNVVYATSYAATRLTLADVPPATLALARLVVGALILLPIVRREAAGPPATRRDRWTIAGMGVLGFGAAFGLANWGIGASTATNAALLIVVEPVALMLLGPLWLGERLARREAAGAALAVVGAAVVVVNGLPGLTARLVPHWRGDLLLVLSGLAYASYSLLGRRVLDRHAAGRITAASVLWGAAALVPLAAGEWLAGRRPVWTGAAIAGTLYLALVVTALGYLVWNWALRRVEAARAAIFLNVQPVAGALLGVLLLGEPLTAFTLGGGALIVAGLLVAFGRAAR
jgi:drug/metabolite transporter (DMT)-like permease